MTEYETIGERLNQLRTTLNLTQKAFAQSIGTNQGFLNNVIKGRRGIGHNILLNIAKAYKNVSLRWLLIGEGEMYELQNIYIEQPPELPSGVQEGIKIEYLTPEDRLEAMERRLEDHERRLRELEGRE